MACRVRVIPTLFFAAVIASAVWSAAAREGENTRYVSLTGKDANACILAAPCRSLQRAINRAPAGGEVRILDSGFYGNNANIEKSLTISGNGNTVYLGSAIIINKAGAVVALRGLSLNGLGTIVDGISIANAAAVHIERCLIHGFTQDGITATADNVKVFVVDTTSRNNGQYGFTVNAQTPQVKIDRSHFDNNGTTGFLAQNGYATIIRSTASGNAYHGIDTYSALVTVSSTMAAQNGSSGFHADPGGTITIEASVAHGNGGAGLAVAIGGVARILNSTFISNNVGIFNSGTVVTLQNNAVAGNGTNKVGNALTTLAPM